MDGNNRQGSFVEKIRPKEKDLENEVLSKVDQEPLQGHVPPPGKPGLGASQLSQVEPPVKLWSA